MFYFTTRSALPATTPQRGEENAKSKPAEEVEMKGATVRRVIGTAFALATATLLATSCRSPGGGTPEPAAYAAHVGDSPCLPATQVAKRNVGCGGGDAISYRQRTISHFIEKNKHRPLFLTSPLLTSSESHRAFMQKVKRKVVSSPHRAIGVSILPALSLVGFPNGSPVEKIRGKRRNAPDD
jgi:hypothetical protein